MIVRSVSQTTAVGSDSIPPDAKYARAGIDGAASPPTVSAAYPRRGPFLNDVLRGVSPQSAVAFWPEFRAPWGAGFQRDWAVFHIVVQGGCWLQLKSVREPVQLREGDFAVVKSGEYHTMRDSPSTPAVDFGDLVQSHAPGKKGPLLSGGEGQTTRLVCGGIEDRNGHPLMANLPTLIHVKGSDNGVSGWVQLTAKQILAELERGGTGSTEVANRLVDALFLQAVRAYLDEHFETAGASWLAAARDPQIGRALAAIHHNPRQSWTVESLARYVAMSRTTFAARFKELVGEPPQHYFTRLRINAAAARLLSYGDKLSRVAAEAGYHSVPAFVRSFKRHVGTTPGEYRKCRGGWPL